MTTALFETDEPSTPQRCPPWLVRELVALGVPELTARAYSMRQAHAVKARMEKAKETAQAGPSPYQEPHQQGATLPERLEVRATLSADAFDWLNGKLTADELYRAVRGSSYVLTPKELCDVALCIVKLLEADR